MQDRGYLDKHQVIWKNKPVLQRIYEEQFYAPLLAHLTEGEKHLEIGSGPGFLADFAPHILRTDILTSTNLNCIVDAHHLPFPDNHFDNIIGLDVLHHFNRPVLMLAEAVRVLRPGGRIIMVEPWITPFSRFIYTYLHQEECNLMATPWKSDTDQFIQGDAKNAFDGNAAIPYLLLTRGQGELKKTLPQLHLLRIQRFSLFTYLLSRGFKPGSLLPINLYPFVYRFEQKTQPLWEHMAALRALIIWEKVVDGSLAISL